MNFRVISDFSNPSFWGEMGHPGEKWAGQKSGLEIVWYIDFLF